MAIIDDFKARFPEFDDNIVDDRLPVLIEIYPAYFNRPYDLVANKEIILNLLAHLLVCDQASSDDVSSGSVVMSQSVGSVSESLAPKNIKSELWDLFGGTKYGQTYIQLTRRFAGGRFL